MRFVFPFAAALLAGCTSLSEIRSAEPYKSAAFAGRADELAACVTYRMKPDYYVEQLYRPRERIAAVTSMAPGGFGPPAPLWELTIAQRSEAEVIAELRKRPTLYTPDPHPAWEALKACAAG